VLGKATARGRNTIGSTDGEWSRYNRINREGRH
jgi:hypothetical protein